MSLIGIKNKLFRGDIYDYVSEEDIMDYYYGPYRVNQRNYCPFEKEKSPSFFIGYYVSGGEQRLKWIRFGRFNDRAHSPIDLVMKLFHLDYIKACQKIYEDLVVNGQTISANQAKPPMLTIKGAITQRLRWQKEDKEYWGAYGITPKHLKKWDVYPAEVYAVAYGQGPFRIKYVHSPGNPMYVYIHDDSKDSFTMYRPLALDHEKWRKHNISGHIMGWDKTYTGSIVAITSSLKDIMVLDMIGVPAVAPHSEKENLPDEKIEILKDMYDCVVVVYDNDGTGIVNSTELTKKFNLDYWNVPKKYLDCKDPADLVKNYGLETLKKEFFMKVYEYGS